MGGEISALIGSLVVFCFVFFVFARPWRWCQAVAIVFIYPLAYQIIANVPCTWLEHQPGFDEADRGRLIGRLNANLAAAQAITALGTGPIVAWGGGALVTPYFACAGVDSVVV